MAGRGDRQVGAPPSAKLTYAEGMPENRWAQLEVGVERWTVFADYRARGRRCQSTDKTVTMAK